MSPEDTVKYDAWNNLRMNGLDQLKINDIILTNKGLRPDPSTYLSLEYIKTHISQFDDGTSFVMTQRNYDQFIDGNKLIGFSDNSQFVTSNSLLNEIDSMANGDIGAYEMVLGFDKGYFQSQGGLVRIDISNLDDLNIRIPSGNELGANAHWLPGGFTEGGTAEAILNQIPNTPDYVTITFK